MITPPGRMLGPDPICRVTGAGIVTVLCVKTPRRNEMLLVPHHVADGWGLPVHQLWETALANLSSETTNRQTHQLAPGVDLFVVSGTSWPGAAHVYRLPNLIPEPLPHGALVTFPTNNAFCAIPLRTADVLTLIPFVLQLTQKLAATDTVPLSPGTVFWFHSGTITDLQAQLTPDGNARLNRSPALTEILNRLR